MTTHVIALSGGKDSTALALALQYYEPRDYIFMINPTGNELPEMPKHFENLQQLFQTEFYTVGCGLTFEELCYDQQTLPNRKFRFCSRVLKIEPTQKFLGTLKDPLLYVGLRADENKREGVDYGVNCRFPLVEWNWGIEEVRRFLRINSVSIPKRTDCALCFWQRIDEWWYLWAYYPHQWYLGERLERDIGHTFRTPGKDTWPTALKDMRKRFELGLMPRKIKKYKETGVLDIETGDINVEEGIIEEKCQVCTK
jgi:hypothetical protein